MISIIDPFKPTLIGVSEGVVKVIAKYGDITSNELTVIVVPKTQVIDYTYSWDNSKNISSNSSNILKEKLLSGSESNLITNATFNDKVYTYSSKQKYNALRLSSSNANGIIDLTLSQDLKKVVIELAGWYDNGSALSINGIKQEYKTGDLKSTTLSFDLITPTKEVKIEATKRCIITKISSHI